MKQWKYYLGAAILGTGLLLKAGAPLVPLCAGLALAAFWTWKKSGRPATNRVSR
jgi:hypothetical protein